MLALLKLGNYCPGHVGVLGIIVLTLLKLGNYCPGYSAIWRNSVRGKLESWEVLSQICWCLWDMLKRGLIPSQACLSLGSAVLDMLEFWRNAVLDGPEWGEMLSWVSVELSLLSPQ